MIKCIAPLFFLFTIYLSYGHEKMIQSKDSATIRISWSNYILDISSNRSLFSGRLTIYTSTYVDGDHRSLYSKKYSTQVQLDPDTVKALFKLFSDLKMDTIPTDKDIKDWRYGTDGITYSIEYRNGDIHSSKKYWTPSAQKNVPEAMVINRFITETKLLLNDKKKWEKFLSSLPTGNSYHYGSMSLITVSNPKDKIIDKVTVRYQEADEPPVVGGRPESVLEFNRYQSNLICTSYSTGSKKTLLEDSITLQAKLVQAIIGWSKNKTSFSLNELGIESTNVEKAARNETRYKLSFPMPANLLINLDSMSFCKQNLMLRTLSTGYDEISVTVKYTDSREEIFNFDSKDLGSGLNLHSYFICYAFLNDILPEEFLAYKFFSEEKLINLIYEYQKIVECEGYYYKEYSSKHPEFSPQERRMMKGWDFRKYLQENKRIKDGQ